MCFGGSFAKVEEIRIECGRKFFDKINHTHVETVHGVAMTPRQIDNLLLNVLDPDTRKRQA